MFQNIATVPNFEEAAMLYQLVKQSTAQVHLLTTFIEMEHAPQQLIKHKKHTMYEQLAEALTSPTDTAHHKYTLTRCAHCILKAEKTLHVHMKRTFLSQLGMCSVHV